MTHSIDLNFKPKSYFDVDDELDFEVELLKQVKSVALKKKIQTLFDEGLYSEVRELAENLRFSEDDRKALEAFHPKYMGGSYLPSAQNGDVEIARILLESVTSDVTVVYAKQGKLSIRYKIVDEYESNWPKMHCKETLTLDELADFIFNRWKVLPHIKDCYGDNIKAALRFISGESYFYPEFDDLIRQRVIEAMS